MDRKQLKALKRVKKYIHDRNVKANEPKHRHVAAPRRRMRALPAHYRAMERMTPEWIARNTRQKAGPHG